jgi:hypothetical protein
MRALIAALLLFAVWATGARSQIIDPDKAKAWLENTFGIRSERVVEATPDALVTIRTIEARPPSDFHVVAHFEDFTGPDPLTPPSSDREYLINCPSRRFHVDRIESFTEHGARGGQSTSFGPDLWGLAVPNSPDEGIITAVCGPSAAQIALQEARRQLTAPPIQDPAPPPAQAMPSPSKAHQTKPAPAPPADPLRKPQPATAAKSSAATGSNRVQLFAGDRVSAQHLLESLPARLPVVKGVGKPEIVAGAHDGRPIYRVQITGFASEADAARYCAAVRAAQQDCFVPP